MKDLIKNIKRIRTEGADVIYILSACDVLADELIINYSYNDKIILKINFKTNKIGINPSFYKKIKNSYKIKGVNNYDEDKMIFIILKKLTVINNSFNYYNLYKMKVYNRRYGKAN